MKTLTLDFLHCIYDSVGTCRSPSEQILKDPVFEAYVKLCYTETAKYKAIPLYKKSDAPHGLDFSNLRLSYRKFYQSAYVLEEKPLCRKLLTQVAEGLSKVEVRFLREVLKGKISFYPKDQYLKDIETNANL